MLTHASCSPSAQLHERLPIVKAVEDVQAYAPSLQVVMLRVASFARSAFAVHRIPPYDSHTAVAPDTSSDEHAPHVEASAGYAHPPQFIHEHAAAERTRSARAMADFMSKL